MGQQLFQGQYAGNSEGLGMRRNGSMGGNGGGGGVGGQDIQVNHGPRW